MKNLKWFLGLALALTFLAWSAPKVLAASDLETALERLKSALNLLAANDSLGSGNFGYYAPAWERGQVLGTQVTACPTSGQFWYCGTYPNGTYPTVTDNIMTCPSGEPTCQSSDSSGTYTPSSSGSNTGCSAPANGCGAGLIWNQTNCSCQGSTTQPSCGTPPACGTNSYLKYPTSGCPYCETSQQPTICPAQPANCLLWVAGSGSACGYCKQQPQPIATCPDGQEPLCANGTAPKLSSSGPVCINGMSWTCQPKQNLQQPKETCNLDGKGEVEGACWQWSKDKYGNWVRNQQGQNNQQGPKPTMPQDYNNEENFDYGRVCTARDAQADVRDAKRMSSEIKSLLKTKNLNADLKAKLTDLQNRANAFVAAVAKPGEDFCDVMDEWRQGSGEDALHPNEELNNLRIVITFPTQFAKIKKELATVEKLIPKKKGVNKELLTQLANYLSGIKTAIGEAEAQFSAGDYDGLWDNLDFQQSGGPGDVRCVLDLAPMFEKIAGIKNMDGAIKAAMEDIRDTFYSSVSEEQFREACQIGNESRNIVEPFLRAKPVTSKAASTKLQNLRNAIENKYGGEQVGESNPSPAP
jgi:hypothetical protein